MLLLALISNAYGLNVSCGPDFNLLRMRSCTTSSRVMNGACVPLSAKGFVSRHDEKVYSYLGMRGFKTSCTVTCSDGRESMKELGFNYLYTPESNYPGRIKLGDTWSLQKTIRECNEPEAFERMARKACIRELTPFTSDSELIEEVCDSRLEESFDTELTQQLRAFTSIFESYPAPLLEVDPHANVNACGPAKVVAEFLPSKVTLTTQRERKKGLSLFLAEQVGPKDPNAPFVGTFALEGLYGKDSAHIETRGLATADLDRLSLGLLAKPVNGGVTSLHVFDERIYEKGSPRMLRGIDGREREIIADYVLSQIGSGKIAAMEAEVSYLGGTIVLDTLVSSVDNGLALPITLSRVNDQGEVVTEPYLALVVLDDFGYELSLESLGGVETSVMTFGQEHRNSPMCFLPSPLPMSLGNLEELESLFREE